MTHSDSSADPARDFAELRRSLRDVVALTMLPTVWAGYEPPQICADLVDVIARMIDTDGVYLTAPGNDCGEILRLKREDDRETERCLRAAAAEATTGTVQTVAGSGVRLLSSSLSFRATDRFLVASRRADFPTEMERLILRVAANQASMWLDWKRAEAAVAAESAFRRAIENSMVAGVAVVDASGRQTYVNRAFAAMVGWSEAELVGSTPPFPYWAPEDAANIEAAFEEVIAGKIDPAGYELRFRRRDEQRFDALVLIAPFEQAGRSPGFLASVYDITERKSAERTARFLADENARLYGNAQEANRVKDEFLANLSHELRTPMTAILGWAHLLQLGDLEPEQVSLGLQTIRQSGEAQAKLIDDLLDVSRIVTGKLHLTATAVRLADIARGAIAAIRPAADAKRHQLEVDLRAEDAIVLGDASRLQQVFWNLLSNAVKFTPPGGIVRIRLADRDSDNVVLTVEDTGEGIPPEFLPLVFERFRQAATAVRGRTGLGLGLAIAKELVEMHGGSIAASSGGRGGGSTFTVTLPRLAENQKPPERRVRAERTHEKLRSLRVLLVEDDEATRTLLATVLGTFGASVVSASCATDAEAALLTFEPEMLITDIEMPGNDGVSLLQQLRARGRSATLPAIAVSGHADDASRERVLAAGFNGFVAKPLDPALLADEMVRALAGG
jgi:PAS domain S-box-containing protein